MAYIPKRNASSSRNPNENRRRSPKKNDTDESTSSQDWSKRIARTSKNDDKPKKEKEGNKKIPGTFTDKKFGTKSTDSSSNYGKRENSRSDKTRRSGNKNIEAGSRGRNKKTDADRKSFDSKGTRKRSITGDDKAPREKFKRTTGQQDEKRSKIPEFTSKTRRTDKIGKTEGSSLPKSDKGYSATRVYKKITDKKGESTTSVRLNKFIANAGICSRREADQLIEEGWIKVNDSIVNTLGSKIDPTRDKVTYKGKLLKAETLRYILLNKPKDFITTTEDPHERNTVMQLIAQACTERVLPVGRLDRNTTGLLLFTNDGDLAKQLTHPSHGVKKLYQVTLDRPISKADMQKIAEGLELEDGKAYIDTIAYVSDEKDTVGLEIHIGRNRIVRRIFEALGYKVLRLDRVMFGILTKKDLPRGNWRHLTEKEVQNLKNLSRRKSSKKSDSQAEADAFLADLDN